MSVAEKISQSIFRAYDIRGVVDETLNKEWMFQIGQAVATEALAQGETTMAVGRDGRLSGPKLAKALIEGLLSTGMNVIDLGRVPTPVLYYATHTSAAKSGVMLTGSHNPVNHNGTKIVINQQALSGDAIQALYQRIVNSDFAQGEGELTKYDIVPDYIKHITGDIKLSRPLKVVVDCGNGIAGLIAPMLLREMGCKVCELYCEVDGNFPNHHPDPSQEENLQDLVQMVCQKNADIGLAFDGDGDRLGVVTGKGDVIWPDRQLILYAISVLKNNPGAKIIYDVKSTRHLEAKIKEHGGIPMMHKTGHSFVKAKMREEGALLGGEMSGHTFFKDRWFGFDDAIYTAARLLELLAADGRDAEQVFSEIPDSVSTPELRIYMDDEKKFDFIEALVKKSRFEDNPELTTIDGLRVDYPDAWGLVRASNTTPYLIVRFEADNEEALRRVQNAFRMCLLALDEQLELPF